MTHAPSPRRAHPPDGATAVEFHGHGDTSLRGWLMTPAGPGPFPCVVMAHGLSAVVEHGLAAYAERFVDAGIATLAYDHAHLGASEGEPRQLVNPWAQARNYRHAIDWVETRPEIDADRLGLWGSSFSGGQVLVVAAIDPRVRAVVANVPFVGFGRSDQHDDPIAVVRAALDDTTGHGPADGGAVHGPLTLVGEAEGVLFSEPAARAFFERPEAARTWRNEIFVQSFLDSDPPWDPGAVLACLATPTLLVLAADDAAAPPDVAVDAARSAPGPVTIVTLECGHFDAYDGPPFDQAVSAMTTFLCSHLADASV